MKVTRVQEASAEPQLSQTIHPTEDSLHTALVSPETTTYTSEDQTPHRTAMSASCRSRITFIDLPPELRNNIYVLALTSSVPVAISLNDRNRLRLYRTISAPHLLLVSRGIHSEAAPVLYGSHECVFIDLRSAAAWTKGIGGLIVHLRQYTLENIYPPRPRRPNTCRECGHCICPCESWLPQPREQRESVHNSARAFPMQGTDICPHQKNWNGLHRFTKIEALKSWLKTMEKAQNLYSLRLCEWPMCVKPLAKLFEPMMRSLRQSNQNADNMRDVTEVLQILGDQRWGLTSLESTERLRLHLRKLLREPKDTEDEAGLSQGIQDMFVSAERE